MPRHAKFESYEQWVVGRIEGSKLKTMSTASLMKLPKYLYDLEEEPDEFDLEKSLRAMRDAGTLAVSSQRWTIRGPFVAPPAPRPKLGAKPDPRQLTFALEDA